MRGEHHRAGPDPPRGDGPSPRAWGAHPFQGHADLPKRTIPTCVGSTVLGFFHPPLDADHPHVRGEHGHHMTTTSYGSGPSPRAWGARRPRRSTRTHPRTIPTCVGSTAGRSRRRWGRADHPHVRGEHLVWSWSTSRRNGPSPRAWGARDHRRRHQRRRRTIPTCVGSTSAAASATSPHSDHPHVRGEHSTSPGWRTRRGGPSPRAWGAPRLEAQRVARRRTIPTCVGSTNRLFESGTQSGDHPHVRGEHA
mgnify:FL=1